MNRRPNDRDMGNHLTFCISSVLLQCSTLVFPSAAPHDAASDLNIAPASFGTVATSILLRC